MNVNISKLRVFFLYCLIFFMPFEYWSQVYVFGQTPTRLAGALYFITALFSFDKMFSMNKHSKIVILPVALWIWLITVELFNGLSFGFDVGFYFQFIYLIVFYFLIINEFRINDRTKWGMMIALVLSMLVVTVLLKLGIGIGLNRENDTVSSLDEVRRVWFFGLNPNALGNYAVLAILFSFFLYFEYFKGLLSKKLILAAIPILFLPLFYSGSSGAFLTLFFGLSIYFSIRKGNVFKKLKFIFLLFLVLFLVFNSLSRFEYLNNKLYLFLEAGNTTGRTEIWASALSVISNNWFFGLGKNGAEFALEKLSGNHYTAHNVYLDVFMWGGIFAILIYLMLFVSVALNSLKYYRETGFSSSLVIVFIMAFLMLKSGAGFTLKLFWFFMPIAGFYVSNLTQNLISKKQ